ncbi:MAG: hypothetical protein A3G25_21445 [Betaproteobacteria bacterium RIFCSPLOWO2_12_FULL_63_13]|nr:MAG: hypothetical protein A3G25_21445 [Betaproteobacteria bacterium RIFCSPLOWO2_12_FULL_63_13]
MRSLFYYSYRRFSRFTHWYERRFTGIGRLVIAAAVAFGIFGVDTEQTTAYQGFAYLVSLIVLAAAASSMFRGRFGVRRDLPRFATAGEPLEYRLYVRNLSRKAERGLTLFEDFEFSFPSRREFAQAREPGVKRNRVDTALGFYLWMWLLAERRNGAVEPGPMAAVPAGAESAATMRMTARRRGVVRFATVSVARTDPLGLCRAFSRVSAPQSVLVLPRRYRLPPITLPGQRRYQPGGVALAGSAGDSEEFFGLRDYRPGDPLQHVHWKSFARTGRPIVKEFQSEFFERHALALDTAFTGAQAFEEAVSVAASFVYTLETQECLLDMLFVGDGTHVYTAGRGLLRAEHLLEVLAGVRMQQGNALERLETAVLERGGGLASCILVLAGWDDARSRLLASLRRSGLQVLAFALVADDVQIDAAQGVRRLRVGSVQQDLAGL